MRSNRLVDCLVYHSVKSSPITDHMIHQLVTCVLTDMGRQGSLSVHFVGEKKMRAFNKAYRGKDRATDVLSFSMEQLSDISKNAPAQDFGDIFLCPVYIQRQARRFGVTFAEETKRMLVHGMLHLLGYDHEKKADAVRMFSLQEYYLSECL